MNKPAGRIVPIPAAIPILLSLVSCAGVGGNGPGAAGSRSGDGEIDPAVHVREGDLAAADGEFDRALLQYAMALEADGGNAELYYKVGFVHESQGRMELAERGFRQALSSSPEHVPARVALGLIALRREEYAYAELVLNQVLERDAGNWRALNALGVLGDMAENFSVARGFYERALEQVPESTDVMNNLGYSLYLQGDLDEAETYFRRVVDKDPGYVQGWSNLALVYLQRGDESLAKLAFENVVDEHQALNNMGYFDLLRQDDESAMRNFRDAARVAPAYYALAYRNMASVGAVETESAGGPDGDPADGRSADELVRPRERPR